MGHLLMRVLFKNPEIQRLALALLLLVGVAVQLCDGQDSTRPHPKRARTPADYQLRTLKEIAARQFDTHNGAGDDQKMIVNGDLHPSRVSATYTGRARPLPQNKRAVLNRWAQLYAGAPTHYTVPYQSELLFKRDGRAYWLAFKKDSVAQFKKQIKAGKAVDLFLIRMGGSLDADKWEPLLLVESFKSIVKTKANAVRETFGFTLPNSSSAHPHEFHEKLTTYCRLNRIDKS
jgi:hypothetical protein